MRLFAPRTSEQRAVTVSDVWGPGYDPTGYSGHTALALSTVLGCVQLRSNLLSQLPVHAVTKRDGVELAIDTQPIVIEDPSPRMVRSTWMSQYSVSIDLWGFACGLIASRDGLGNARAVEWLPPWDVSIEESQLIGGMPTFRVGGQPVDHHDLLYIPGLTLPGSMIGIAPLEKTGLVELSKLAQGFGRDWFRHGAVPSSIIYSEQDLGEDEADKLRRRVMSRFKKRQPAVLGAGLKYEALSVNANESQFLETMRDTRVQICNVFLVPPEELSVATGGTSLTYANREQRTQQMLVNMLNAAIVRFEEALARLLPAGHHVRVDTNELLRSDLQTRVSTGAQAVQARIMLPNEWRIREGLPPLPGGDQFPLPPETAPSTPGARNE